MTSGGLLSQLSDFKTTCFKVVWSPSGTERLLATFYPDSFCGISRTETPNKRLSQKIKFQYKYRLFCHHIHTCFSLHHAELIQQGQRDKERKRRRILSSPSQKKGDRGLRGAPLLPVSFYLTLLLPNISYSM